jgi:hypothetical protein
MKQPTSSTTTLYLRGMPTALVRETKAEAARTGKALAELVSDALSLRLRQTSPRVVERALRREIEWYEQHRAELAKRYPGEYVAIVAGAVVDHDRNFDPLARRVFERFEARDVFMPRVGVEARKVRVRSPRVRASGARVGR